jgi:dTDP-4-amino-4,6-dideoxygalactose transaminase
MLAEIPGIKPAKLHEQATRSAYHLYMFRYDASAFAGLDRGKFLESLQAEGVPCSAGYGEMNKGDYVSALAQDKHFLRIYGEARLKEWLGRNQDCPQNQQLCRQVVWFTQNMLLGPRADMEKIAEAIRRIHKHSAELAKAKA